MPRTITDQEFAHLMGRKQVADFIEPIYNSKELGPEARALIKKAYPNLAIEGYDLKQELKEDIAKLRTEVQETEKKRKDTEDSDNFKKLRNKTKEDFKFTDEGMDKLEKLMVERNIGDYEAGALLMASKEPKASEPTPGSQRYWNHEKAKGFEDISKDPERWGFNELLGAAERDAQRAKNQGF